MVIRLAREKGDVYLDNKQICFYPDYCIEIQCRMNGFNEVKTKLWEKNIEYPNTNPIPIAKTVT